MMESNLTLWRFHEDQLTSRDVADPLSLNGDLAEDGVASRIELCLWPVTSEDDIVAALLVPPDADREAACNRIPLMAGVHLVQHTDRIDVNGAQFWVAASRRPEITNYDPERHGSDLRCFITKAPMQPGDAIVRCPGRPGVPCDIIYRRASWDAAIDADPKFRCPQCRFDPFAREWQPKLSSTSSLNRFLELARSE